jgi:hypothetical protein
MAGLGPAIHAVASMNGEKGVDGRDELGHDR